MSLRDPLDDMMDGWHPPTEVPDVRAEIRREIARPRRDERGSWIARLECAFARPSFAIAFVAACVFLGLFLAAVRVSRLHAENGAQIARSYVQLIDPLLDRASAPAAVSPPRP